MLKIPNYTFNHLGISSSLISIINWSSSNFYNFEEIHSHNYIDILVFEKGGGTHFIDFKEYNIESNSIHIVSNLSTHLANRAESSKGFSILISPLFLNQLQEFDNRINYLDFFNHSKIVNYNSKVFNDFKFFFDELKKSNNNDSYQLNLMSCLLSKFISSSSETIIEFKIHSELIKLFMDYLNLNFKDKNCLINFQNIHHITEINFRRKFVKLIGKTPKQLLNERIVLEAKKMLFNKENSIKEIVFELGFESETYFSRFFKKHTGISPVVFQKSH